jgi:predicted metal-binding membrane protein
MASVLAARPVSRRAEFRRLRLRRPEIVAELVVALCWIALVALTLRADQPAWAGASRPTSHGMSAMPGMVSGHGGGGLALDRLPTAFGAQLGVFILMSVAMMGPAAIAGVRHTGLNSLRWRRRRAMAEFSAGYLAIWIGFGLITVLVSGVIPGASSGRSLAIVLAGAAWWQLTSFKRRALRACHHSIPLPPYGWRAEWAAAQFGVRNGAACVGSCWLLMLITMAAPGGYLLWTVAITGIVSAERFAQRPRTTTRTAAWVLGSAALATVFVTFA